MCQRETVGGVVEMEGFVVTKVVYGERTTVCYHVQLRARAMQRQRSILYLRVTKRRQEDKRFVFWQTLLDLLFELDCTLARFFLLVRWETKLRMFLVHP